MKPFGHALARIAALVACGVAVTSAVAQPPQPHLAVFADGAEVPGAVTDLADPTKAKIAGRALFDPAKPVRWVRMSTTTPKKPDAFVEFDNGDLLPGTVVGHEPEGIAWRTLPPAAMPMNHPESCPAALVVAVTTDVASGAIRVAKYRVVADSGLVRVRRDRVRRITWKREGDRPLQPRTIFLADGTAVAYRSLRWTDDGVIALLDDGGTQRHPLESLVELHLAAGPDPWSPWFDALVNESGVMTLETATGVRTTTPRTRYRAAPGIPVPTIMVQPSWSLDPLFISLNALNRLLFHPAAEPPLTWLAPSRVAQRSAFGGSWTWQANTNVYGGPLHAAGPPAGWGFGVQARTELAFPLCAGVQGFRGTVGLDRAVLGGGCIRATVHLENAGAPPVWDSGLLVGSGTLADCGTIPLQGPAAGQKELVLVVDDAHRDRPPGADPFDIRDAADWVDPRLVLEPVEVKARLAARLAAAVPALVGWQAETAPGGTTRAIDAIDPILPSERAGWAGATVTEGAPLRLKREWASLPDDANLVIAASTVGTVSGSLELQVDGWRWTLPVAPRSTATAVPFVLRLAGRPAEPLRVEIGVPAGLTVQWHALGVTGEFDSKWVPLEPVKMESSGGSTFKQRDDGAIVVSMPPPNNDAYTLRLRGPAEGIRTLRIDALTDPSLAKPQFGPGRPTTNGVFRMSSLALSSVAGEDRSRVEIATAFCDPVSHVDYGPMEAVRRNPKMWWQGVPGVANAAVFHLRSAQPTAAEVVLELEFRAAHPEAGPMSLGCFRVYGSPEPDARLPVTHVTHLVRQPDPADAPARKTVVGVPLAEPAKP